MGDVESNCDGGENESGGDNGYGTYVRGNKTSEEKVSKSFDHANHQTTNNWYRIHSMTSSSFVLLFVVAISIAAAIGCAVINNLQLLSSSLPSSSSSLLPSSSSIAIVDTASSVFEVSGCPTSNDYLSYIYPSLGHKRVSVCRDFYFEDNASMESEADNFQMYDSDNTYKLLPGVLCEDRNYPSMVSEYDPNNDPDLGSTCYEKWSIKPKY